MKWLLMVAASLALAALGGKAFAQFDGIYAGAGIGLYRGEIEIPDRFTFSDNAHTASLNLAAGYGRSFDRFHLAGELSYANAPGKATIQLGTTSEAKLENAWALSVLPGLKFGDNALAYGRIGFASAKTSGSFFDPDGGQTHNGNLWGVGTKLAFDRRFSLTVEYQVYDLKTKDYAVNGQLRPGSNGVVIGVQYAL